MSSCGLYTKFETPEATPDKVYGEKITATNDTTTAVAPWREVFTDTLLTNLIEQALVENSDMQIAKLRVEQAQARVTAAKLAYVPSLGIKAEGTIADGGSKSLTVPINAQWEIDLFGRLRNAKQQAQATMLQSENYVQLIQTQLITGVAINYYTLVMLDQQMEITLKSIKNLESNLEVIIALKEAGMQTEAAVNQAKANISNVKVSVHDLRIQINTVEGALAMLINKPHHTIARSTFKDSNVKKIELKEEYPILALSNRPDVKDAEYQLRNQFYGVNAARANFYPAITLGGTMGWHSTGGILKDPYSFLMSAIGSITQPLFNRGVNITNLKVAKAQYEQSLITFQKTILLAGNEVNNVLAAGKNGQQKLIHRKQQVEENQKAVENSTYLMQYGSASYLEVLIAQNTLLQAELQYTADWFKLIQGKINLYKALGGGIE